MDVRQREACVFRAVREGKSAEASGLLRFKDSVLACLGLARCSSLRPEAHDIIYLAYRKGSCVNRVWLRSKLITPRKPALHMCGIAGPLPARSDKYYYIKIL